MHYYTPWRLIMLLSLSALVFWTVFLPIASLTVAPSPNLVWKPYLQQLSDDGVIILWTTQVGTTASVRYSEDTSYAASATAVLRTLNVLGTRLHRVQLSNLQPNTTYYYKVYTDAEELLPGETLSFRTAPPLGSTEPFTFLAFGDYGVPATAATRPSQLRLRDQMLRDSFRFIVTTGDNAYQQGKYEEFDANVFQVYGDVFSKAAVFPSLGNHDYYHVINSVTTVPYRDLFDLPGNAWRSNDHERYYSFDYGNVHVVALDSNSRLDIDDGAATDDMLDWLRDDLRRTTQRWKIVTMHHSAYSIGTSHGSDTRVRTKLVPIFEQYGVDLVLSGHDHIYQRSKPLHADQVTTREAGGIVYVVSGAGAEASYGCGSAEWVALALCAKPYGMYSRITVQGDSLKLEAVRDTGEVKDSRTLTRRAPTATITPTAPGASTPIPTRPPVADPTITPTATSQAGKVFLPVIQ